MRLANIRLGTGLFLGFGSMLLLLTVVTSIAAAGTQGATQLAVVVSGATGIAAGIVIAWWSIRRITTPLAHAVRAAKRISSGDLTSAVEVTGGGEIGELMQALHDMHERVFKIVNDVRTGTTTVASTSSQISWDNTALSERTEAQSGSLEETASSMEELTSAVKQNADNARQANSLVMSASDHAVKGGRVVAEVVQMMGSIRESSRKIVDIISVIDGIAFQTNILALNAAVEAARAGEQGRGFAVVASEVRTLAQRSASAAKEIKSLIGASVEKVDAGGKLVDDAGKTMDEIVASVKQVAAIMQDINNASQEQSVGIESVNRAIAQIDGMTHKNAMLVEDATKTAATLNEQAVSLMKAVGGFKLGGREHGNAEEAVALVKAGYEFYRSHGKDALIAEINKLAKGRFLDRDLYLMVFGADNAVYYAHGVNRRVLGIGPETKDVDGKLFVWDMVKVAKEKGEGWVDYKYAHPITNEIGTKATYLVKAGDVVIACGIYKT